MTLSIAKICIRSYCINNMLPFRANLVKAVCSDKIISNQSLKWLDFNGI